MDTVFSTANVQQGFNTNLSNTQSSIFWGNLLEEYALQAVSRPVQNREYLTSGQWVREPSQILHYHTITFQDGTVTEGIFIPFCYFTAFGFICTKKSYKKETPQVE